MIQQVTFTNPATGATYVWERNPSADGETAGFKQRNISRTSRTATHVGPVRQQGDDGPIIHDWTINVLSSAMEEELWSWYVLCNTQTILVTDWDGDQYEGQIIYLSRARKAASTQYAVYEIQFEVYRLISGVLATAGVTP